MNCRIGAEDAYDLVYAPEDKFDPDRVGFRSDVSSLYYHSPNVVHVRNVKKVILSRKFKWVLVSAEGK